MLCTSSPRIVADANFPPLLRSFSAGACLIFIETILEVAALDRETSRAMTPWIYPAETPQTAAEWLALRSAVEDALRLRIDPADKRRYAASLWVFVALGFLSALLYVTPVAKRRSAGKALRCWEKDDRDYLHPIIQEIFPLFSVLYAIGAELSLLARRLHTDEGALSLLHRDVFCGAIAGRWTCSR